MVLIVGLGNPGKEYERSRHNLGFLVVDRLAEMLQAPAWKRQHNALVTRGSRDGRAWLLAKPQTYMNHSGEAVQALLHYYRVPLPECLVIVDDLDLQPGKIRMRAEGSDGGHRGLRSIIQQVGSRAFKRMRIGIGRPPEKANVVSYVLGGGSSDETLNAAVEEAARLVLAYVETGRFENWSSP
ncbi:MAG TPA: aminoacyl-tRNA hydrolase [bacterium]|nr:aminoacyl-tRNA hydrolase [bacterium]